MLSFLHHFVAAYMRVGPSEFLLGVVDDTILVSQLFFFFLDCVVTDGAQRYEQIEDM